LDLQVNRFIAAQAVMLSLIGVPGIYFHSLFGLRGWLEGVEKTGRNRTINREKLQYDEVQNELANENSLRYNVFAKFSQLLKVRSGNPAFHPRGTQRILNLHPSVFALERISPDGNSRVLCLHNVSAKQIAFETGYVWSVPKVESSQENLLSKASGRLLAEITLEPYQVLWMEL
jgi:sucrose phosphorylase